MNLLAYIDGSGRSQRTLQFAAVLKQRLGGKLAVITVRPGTSGVEPPPPLGVEVLLETADGLPPGLQVLTDAAVQLSKSGVIDRNQPLTFREMPGGNLFVCKTPTGERIPFYERFGGFIDSLNQEVDAHGYDLLLIAPPQRKRVHRLLFGSTPRKLALDLHTSVLFVRQGGPDSRLVVCSDGSTASRRQFPFLKSLLPSIHQEMELVWIKAPDTDLEKQTKARHCLDQASRWLKACGKRVSVTILEGDSAKDLILRHTGEDVVLMLGASLRHDVYRRTLGSLPIKVIGETEASVLLVKAQPEIDGDLFREPFSC
ncbi:MAG: hypothetical protein ACOWWM_20150 [Desulfobacterales bacterium]